MLSATTSACEHGFLQGAGTLPEGFFSPFLTMEVWPVFSTKEAMPLEQPFGRESSEVWSAFSS